MAIIETAPVATMGRFNIRKVLRYTPHYQAAMLAKRGVKAGIKAGKRRRLLGDSLLYGDDLLGKAKKARKAAKPKGKRKFLPGVSKAARTVGKFTSPITTAIAKGILPKSLVDAASRFDPTKGKVTPSAVSQAVSTAIPETALPSEPVAKFDLKEFYAKNKLLILAGGGGIALLLVLSTLKR